MYDQREIVLKAVQRLEPGFEPQYTPPILDYNCPLLDKIKLDNIQNRKGLLISPASDLITLEELKTRGREQLEMEMMGEIEVQNIAIKDEESKNVEIYVS